MCQYFHYFPLATGIKVFHRYRHSRTADKGLFRIVAYLPNIKTRLQQSPGAGLGAVVGDNGRLLAAHHSLERLVGQLRAEDEDVTLLLHAGRRSEGF